MWGYNAQWGILGGRGFVTIVLLKRICFVFHDKNGKTKRILNSFYIYKHCINCPLGIDLILFQCIITFPVHIFIHEWIL